jgi:biotin synthase-related radical SAM superfamily protein
MIQKGFREVSSMNQPAEKIQPAGRSPERVRMSLAAAMTLGLAPGTFYRGAKLGCINLLMTYPGGCRANCQFCGLAREKNAPDFDPKFEKFIRVAWRTWSLDEVVERCQDAPDHVGRVCISEITHPSVKQDTLEVCNRIFHQTGLPLSVLMAPTLSDRDRLCALRQAGTERIGVAIDAATPELFAALRGKAVGGPHRWDHYWRIFEQALEVFGQGMVGVHLIHGLGETEQDLIMAMDRARTEGGSTHLFCFFPEKLSAMAQAPRPPASGYRRVQMARWLIDRDLARAGNMSFDQAGRVLDFGVSAEVYETAMNSGKPFMTSGCPGADGEVACNRPYGNEKPGDDLRNYPFALSPEDISLVKSQIVLYE